MTTMKRRMQSMSIQIQSQERKQVARNVVALTAVR